MLPTVRRIAVAAVAVVALAACGADDGPVDDTTEERAETDEPAELEEPADEPDEADPEEADPDDGDTDPAEEEAPAPAETVASGAFGVLAGQADASVDDVVAAAEEALADAPAEIAFEVDHAQAAEDAGLGLPATRLLVFGDPEVGTPLMQEEPLIGLDLPAKLLIWDDDGTTLVGVNDPRFLAQRHGLDPGLAPLAELDQAQRNLLDAVGAVGVPASLDPGNVPEGIETLDSDDGFGATLERAREAIEAGGPELVAEIDHAAAAESLGMELADSTLLVFGNPEAGTPLMDNRRNVGIDLPQKLLVYDDGGQVHVAYNDPAYLRSRHLLAGVDEPLAGVGDALAGIASAAAGE
jgi:uncharacterized protein (DUF302 family)